MTLTRKTPMVRTAFKPTEPKTAKGIPKLVTCRACRQKFTPSPPSAQVCGVECSLAKVDADKAKQQRKAAKAERAITKAKLDSMRPRKWYVKTLKTALHGYIRARDEGKPCISCDTLLIRTGRLGGDYDAGHMRSVGSAKHLEFDERQIFGQCKYCNDYLKGNQIEYIRRARLRVGDAQIDAVLADNEPRKYTIADFERMTAEYRAKLKALQK